MDSTALVVLEKSVYTVVSDVITEMTLEDAERGFGPNVMRRVTPARTTAALLTLERLRMMAGRGVHPLADIHAAFALLVPEANR